jgi:hypothetical protein
MRLAAAAAELRSRHKFFLQTYAKARGFPGPLFFLEHARNCKYLPAYEGQQKERGRWGSLAGPSPKNGGGPEPKWQKFARTYGK